MLSSTKKGLGFGITSGIITTLGLMIGLYSSTNSKAVVLSGILVITIADALSDAFGMHISEESSHKNISQKSIWRATFSTFIFKAIFALIFIIPILTLKLQTAIITSALIGIILLTIFSYHLAKQNKMSPLKVIAEHIAIAIIVIIITYFVGEWSTKII